LDSCVLTSATLKIWDSFDYIKNILHLDSFEFFSLKSDFDYSKQALLFIPNDLWDIRTNLDVLKEFLLKFFLIVKWKTLVLTTAFTTIKELYIHTNKDLKSQDISLFAQGFWGSKHKLLEFFKQDSKKSILIWTDTFWEWIDIAWEDLSYLIIHKFPFIVPNDPIFMARSSLFKDAFRDYSIPKTIIKLKQWFWRLIRTKEDLGVAILLDNRIITTNWWEIFFEAFPKDINIKIWSSDNFLKIMEKKMEEKN
jgi:Rad3-related DNA helicase